MSACPSLRLMLIKIKNDIRESIRLLAKSENWPENISINQWGNLWTNKYQTGLNFKCLIRELSFLFYSQSAKSNIETLCGELINLIIARKKL